jgi:cytochrome c-type protein NapB
MSTFPLRFADLAKFALAAGVMALGVALHVDTAGAADAAPAAPVKMHSLRGGTPIDADNPPEPARQERDGGPKDRDFVQQPPLIPHTIEGYAVTTNFNKCMDCHAWSRTRQSGATKVSVTHFRTREGMELDNISPRRYFCTQCHVPQTDARPLVDNTFQRAQGLR